jgi:hypothetical protein
MGIGARARTPGSFSHSRAPGGLVFRPMPERNAHAWADAPAPRGSAPKRPPRRQRDNRPPERSDTIEHGYVNDEQPSIAQRIDEPGPSGPTGQARPRRSRTVSSPRAGCAVRLTRKADHLEVTFERGFTSEDVAAVKRIPGRRWHSARQVWTRPGDGDTLERLNELFRGRLVSCPPPDGGRAQRDTAHADSEEGPRGHPDRKWRSIK